MSARTPDAPPVDAPVLVAPAAEHAPAGPLRTAGRLVLIAGLLAAVWAVVDHLVHPPFHGFFDLDVYRGAVTWWLHGSSLYGYELRGTGYGFTYPVFAALVMTPASLVSWPVAIAVSTAASSVVVLLTTWWLVAPIARRKGWTPWFAVGVALPFVLETEPVRETIGFGQVNLFLVALVLADVLAARRGWRWAGIGTGIAAAVKLTPAVFLLYFFFTGRRRAAWTGAGTFLGATVLAAVVAPSMTIEYWGSALFQTSRIGHLDGTSNQSLMGLLARVAVPGQPSKPVWAVLCLAVVVVGLGRAVRAQRAGDEAVGVALAGLVGCLVSPISWTHHFYWIVPAGVALADVVLGRRISAEGSPFLAAHPVAVRRWAAAALVVLIGSFGSAMVWFFHSDTPGVHFGGAFGFLVEDTYVLIAVGLLLFTPIRAAVTREPGLTGSAAPSAARTPAPSTPA